MRKPGKKNLEMIIDEHAKLTKDFGRYIIFNKEINRYTYDVVSCATSLISSAKGSYDAYPSHSLVQYYFISCRLAEWMAPCDWESEIDDSIQKMLKIAIRFYRNRDYTRDIELYKKYKDESNWVLFPMTEQEHCEIMNKCSSNGR